MVIEVKTIKKQLSLKNSILKKLYKKLKNLAF